MRGVELVDVAEEAVVVTEYLKEGRYLAFRVAGQAENYVSGVERLELAAGGFVEVAETVAAALQYVDVGHGVLQCLVKSSTEVASQEASGVGLFVPGGAS